MIPPFALGLASKIGIRGFIGIGLVLALAFMWWRADTISGQRDKFRDAFVAEQTRHAVTRASLEKLEARLKAMIADGKARSERQQEALQEQREHAAALDGQIARIRAERVQKPPVGQECKSPDAVLSAEGL